MLRQIDFICVGNLKKDYLKNLEKGYLKNFKLTVINNSDLETESLCILKILNNKFNGKFYVLFDLEGEKFDKVVFERNIKNSSKKKGICFIIGGSNGVNVKLKRSCDLLLKFSNFTYSHQIFRIACFSFVERYFVY